MPKVDLTKEEDIALCPSHRLMAHALLLLRVLVEKQHGAGALPDLPDLLEPPAPPERDSDLDELRRILRDNPALVVGLRTGDFQV